MSFIELDIKREYRTLNKNIVHDFFMPLMAEANLYQRAVGFFSSTALSCYSYGISQLVKNGGHVQLVASPKLSQEDIEAIEKGYELRDDIIEKCLLDALHEPVSIYDEKRLNLLASLIAAGKLDIKIAYVENGNSINIYHEKLGLFYDKDGNTVCFTGSMNESANGFSGNYEAVDVYCSWMEPDRVDDKIRAFTKIWEKNEESITIKEFPNIEKEILRKYKLPAGEIDLKVDEKEFDFEYVPEEMKLCNNKYKITFSEDVLYDYQKAAIDNWVNNNYHGIFDMCTGAGKTFTAIGAIKRAFDNFNENLAVIIVVPYQHLVEQWLEDLNNFNIFPIVGYGIPKYSGYKEKLKKAIFRYNLGAKPFFCFITTNSSFVKDNVQELLGTLKRNVFLLVDEAHNFGSNSLLKTLNERYELRLALSATIERHGDEAGTAMLCQFFGNRCIKYKIEDAIRDKKLTEYYYYPIPVTLSDDELDKYEKKSKEIRESLSYDKNGNVKLSEKAKKIAIERARIVAGAVGKIEALRKAISDYRFDNNMLIYCGATSIKKEDYYEDVDSDTIRQIDLITEMLYKDLNMKVAQFTSKEDMKRRNEIKKMFKEGRDLQALVAIKCLDEGVNIPSIKTAFILASTTNPKEYIQRRGRVLRTATNKEYAIIYDFITLPRPIYLAQSLPHEDIQYDYSLIRNELNRMIEFKRVSKNPLDADKLINDLIEVYGDADNGINEILFEEEE